MDYPALRAFPTLGRMERSLGRIRSWHPVLAALAIAAAVFAARLVMVELTEPLWRCFGQGHHRSPAIGPWAIFWLGVVFGPPIETFIFQWLVFRLAAWLGLMPRHHRVVIIISSVIFGLNHYSSVLSIISAFAAGLVLNAAFWLLGCGRRAFKIVAGAHAVVNVVALIAVLIRR